MKHIFLNLKRFDIAPEYGGVNRLAPAAGWGRAIVERTQERLRAYSAGEAEFVMYFPEAHILSAAAAKTEGSPVKLGCQGIYRDDTSLEGNFGAFTTNRTGNAMVQLGCESVLVGHCEERADRLGVLASAGVTDERASAAVNVLMNQEIRAAQAAGLSVLYCVGENSAQQARWRQVLGEQLTVGLAGVDRSRVVIAYEPIWSIGPGKTPADRPYIEKAAKFIKEQTDGLDVVYGGGLKADNAAMRASIPEISGGLIALTRFSGDIGFYPEEYLEIIHTYLGK